MRGMLCNSYSTEGAECMYGHRDPTPSRGVGSTEKVERLSDHTGCGQLTKTL